MMTDEFCDVCGGRVRRIANAVFCDVCETMTHPAEEKPDPEAWEYWWRSSLRRHRKWRFWIIDELAPGRCRRLWFDPS